MTDTRISRPVRVLVAKAGLDGHDRGALVIARLLRDAGYEVIYTGRRRTPAEIAAIAQAEDVQVVGLSILSGAHVDLTRETIAELRKRGCDQIAVALGGTVLKSDEPMLRELGVTEVFPTGTPLAECVAGIGRAASTSLSS
jgi:methylmalonyl-CoA mutase C-terminal domain/subunit